MKSFYNTTYNHFAKKDGVFGIRITKLVHNCLDMKQHHMLCLPYSTAKVRGYGVTFLLGIL